MREASAQARLAPLTALAGFALGGAALGLGIAEGAIAFWGFGAACLLQVPPVLSLRARIRDGLGNRGLERERLTLRTVGHLLSLLALGMALASVLALQGACDSIATPALQGVAVLSLGSLSPLWAAKRRLSGFHPTLDLDAARTRTWLELAALLLLGSVLGRWFPWADAVTGLGLALRIFIEGRSLAKAATLKVACGGCGSGSCAS